MISGTDKYSSVYVPLKWNFYRVIPALNNK